jgi:hypothetical protein
VLRACGGSESGFGARRRAGVRNGAARAAAGEGATRFAGLSLGYDAGMAADKQREESDQLPEDAPPEQSPEDDEGTTRDEAEHSSGVPNEEGQATGNPANAG